MLRCTEVSLWYIEFPLSCVGQNDLYMYYIYDVLSEFELATNIVITLLFYLNKM